VFITAYTRSLHQSLTSTRSVKTIPRHLICLRSILILSIHLIHGLPSCTFPSDFPINILHTFFFTSPSVLHALSILLDTVVLIILGEECKLCSFSCSLSKLHLASSSSEVISSAPCSQTSSVHVPPLLSETKFHTHTELQAKLSSCIL
jgi:hypothetical protein